MAKCSVDPYKGKIPPPFGKIFGWSIMALKNITISSKHGAVTSVSSIINPSLSFSNEHRTKVSLKKEGFAQMLGTSDNAHK